MSNVDWHAEVPSPQEVVAAAFDDLTQPHTKKPETSPPDLSPIEMPNENSLRRREQIILQGQGQETLKRVLQRLFERINTENPISPIEAFGYLRARRDAKKVRQSALIGMMRIPTPPYKDFGRTDHFDGLDDEQH